MVNEIFGDVQVTVNHSIVLPQLTCIEASPSETFRFPLFSEFISQDDAGLAVDSPLSVGLVGALLKVEVIYQL